jgi:hypothetical protein
MLPDELKSISTVEALASAEPEAVVGGKLDRGEITLEIAADRIVAVCRFLKKPTKVRAPEQCYGGRLVPRGAAFRSGVSPAFSRAQ